jgi:hypothetical protein
LIGNDFYTTDELVSLAPDEAIKTNAFDWATAFPDVAGRQGFDAVVGNPPWLMAGYYVPDSVPYFQRTYSAYVGKADLYYLFLEKAIRLVNPDGRIGMIVPSKFFHTQSARALRELLIKDSWIDELVDFGIERIFSTATNYSSIVLLSRHSTGPVGVTRAKRLFRDLKRFTVPRAQLGVPTWHLIDPARAAIWKQVEAGAVRLEDLVSHFGNGVQTGSDRLLIMSDSHRKELGLEPAIFRPILKGRNVRRFRAAAEDVVLFPYDKVGSLLPPDKLSSRYPAAWRYLSDHKKQLSARKWFGKGAKELSGQWYGMMFLDAPEAFEGQHLVTPALSARSNFAIDAANLFVTGTAGVSSATLKSESDEFLYFVLGILNCKLISEYIIDHSTPYQGGYFKFSTPYIRRAPIRCPDLSLRSGKAQQSEIASLAKAMIAQSGEDDVLDTLQYRLDELALALYEIDESDSAALER